MKKKKLKVVTKHKQRSATFAAVYCVYDDVTWLRESVISVYDACAAIYFLVGDKPWQGAPTSNDATLAAIASMLDPARKLRVVKGSYNNETEQRNIGLDLLAKEGIDYCFVVDADEIYESDALRRMMQYAAREPTIECWHMTWDTYWKSPAYVIEPREPFKPVVFVKTATARFVDNRNVGGKSHGFIPPEAGFCHHLSYARSDNEIRKKISTFSHAHEVRADWFDAVWRRFDSEPLLTNLHPTHPEAYARAVPRPGRALARRFA